MLGTRRKSQETHVPLKQMRSRGVVTEGSEVGPPPSDTGPPRGGGKEDTDGLQRAVRSFGIPERIQHAKRASTREGPSSRQTTTREELVSKNGHAAGPQDGVVLAEWEGDAVPAPGPRRRKPALPLGPPALEARA